MGIDDFRHSYPLRTVCEVTRDIHDLLAANKDRVGEDLYNLLFLLLQEQMRMQKKMDLRLRHYKSDYENGFYKENSGHRALSEKREVLYQTL